MIEYTYPSPEIAKRIQQVFFDNGLTDRKASDDINCAKHTILAYRLAVTNPSIKFIRYLCSTYHIDANWLLDLKGDNNE